MTVARPAANSPLFLTGASGFVGNRLLRLLMQSGHSDVRLLTRNPAQLKAIPALPRGWQILVGDLADSAPWSAQLRGVETVLHLAAATGKVPRRTHLAVTVDGTRRLLAEAARAGVRRFLYVSSIAVCYRERRHYHYAEAKAAAETLVREASGLDGLIIRPTLVLGPGSTLLASLRKLALLPLPVVFGDGRQPVQPVHVDDLARVLLATLALPEWNQRVITVAGPEAVSIEALLCRIRAAEKPGARVVHLPIGPVRALLALLEPVLLRFLPFTAGQLAFFANPSLPPPEPLPAGLPEPMLPLDAMLERGGVP